MQHIMAIDAIIVEDMKTNEYFVQFSVYFQRVIPSEKVEIVSTLYFNTAKRYSEDAVQTFCAGKNPCKRAKRREYVPSGSH